MPIRVSPTLKKYTHHLSLEDADGNILGINVIDEKLDIDPLAITKAPIDRSATKTFSGNQQYSDYEPPWAPIAQSNWEGGGLLEDYDDDVSRFLWNRRTNPSLSKIILGPRDTYTKGYRDMDFSLPGSMTWTSVISDWKYLAIKFTASASYNVTGIYVHVKRKGTPSTALTVALCSDSAGTPGAVLQSTTITTTLIDDIEAEFYKVTITSQAIVSGTDYWVKVYSTGGEEDNCWKIGRKDSAGTTKYSSDNTTWSSALGFDLYYMVTADDLSRTVKFFDYKRAKYAVFNPASGAPTIYIIGDRGVADSNAGALTTVVDGSKSWTADEFIGAIVLLTAGTGSLESQNWRKITDNDGTTLTVDSAWEITHDTTTEYVILGSDVLKEVASHGITAPVTDILVINDIVYFALGESANMRRMQWTAASLYEWADDGVNKATRLTSVYDATDGLTIWRANNSYPYSVSKEATIPAWGTDITFAAAITFKDDYGRINYLISYGEPEVLWVMREGMIFYITAGVAVKVKLDEIKTVMDTSNCKAVTSTNVYLVFNLGASIQQYYSSELSDIGFNREAGLPSNLQGDVSCLLAYPGKIYASIDGNSGNYSSVVMRYGSAWAELYRAPTTGQSISAISFQAVPGGTPDRLYVAVGNHIIWLCHPSDVDDPTQDTEYTYVHEGSLTTGYMYANMFDVDKLFHSIKLFATNLSDDIVIEVDYQLDDDTAWATIEDEFNTSPSQEVGLDEDWLGETGKRIRIRVRLITNNKNISPQIKASVVEGIYRVAVKHSYSFGARIMDYERNMLVEEDDTVLASDKMDILRSWSSNLTPLKMRSIYEEYDDKRVFIDPYPSRPTKEHSESYYIKIILVEL